MKLLIFLAVFAASSVVAAVAFVTAAFIFWSFLEVQPGTATALGTLFLVAPSAGVLTGLYTAARVVKPPPANAGEPSGRRWMKAALAAAIGFLFGYGATRAITDLVYVDRFTNPASAPALLPAMPIAAGIVAAIALGLLSARSRL
jgi:hypothetical protein